jgi:peptidoglycan hydrolase-like protein with peptidoglycan-binding domain
MTSIVSHVAADEDHRIIFGETGKDVSDIQSALSSAGFRVIENGVFDDATQIAVRAFQASQGLTVDGEVGPKTASFLDLPHAIISDMAKPIVMHAAIKDKRYEFPHDDTSSMKAFYGDPSSNNEAWQRANLVPVVSPWQMFGGDKDDGKSPVKAIYIHKKAAPAFLAALTDIWAFYKNDVAAIHQTGMHRFSGAYNYRPIRGSSRLSCHAFGAAIDFDSARNQMNYEHKSNMAQPVVDAFKSNGAWWGGDYSHRQDPMHFQWAHE